MEGNRKNLEKWEVSIIELDNHRRKFKVIQRMPELMASETRMFKTKEEAKKQFEEWPDTLS